MIVVKNFLGHVSLQTTQIYTEITQDTMDRQLKAWNDKWFPKELSENNCCNCFRQKPGNTIKIAINLQQLFVDNS